ncbi:unnamed protein product, partial [Rotaria sp. Silwood1]
MHFAPVIINNELYQNANLKPEVYNHYLKPYLFDGSQSGAFFLPILLHPKSKGEITLASRDPFAHPIINPNYLEDEEDFHTLVEACKLVEKICQSEPLKGIFNSTAKVMNVDEVSENEDQFWESFVRKYSVTVYHPIGT